MSNNFLHEERSFLDGPRGRFRELKYLFAVCFQFLKGFRTMHFMGPCITIFGSARFNDGHPYYETTRSLAKSLSKLGYTIMTGGGPGIMEAANRGAKDAGGLSIGCNIILPREQNPNPYLDKFVNIDFFFIRKELLRKYSFAFIAMPGGFGTLDELFETITLIQTKKIQQFPIVIMDIEYHKDLILHINKMIEVNAISENDKKLILFTDSIEDAIIHIQTFVKNKTSHHKPKWWLGEQAISK